MIVISLRGGLGNQLFQYATGRMLALKHQTELVLDLEWFRNTPFSNTRRTFDLFKYSIVARQTSNKESFWCRLHSNYFFRRVGVNWGGLRLYREHGFNFESEVLSIPDMTYLSGYWQSYCYFEEIAEIIRLELIPIVPPSLDDSLLINQMLLTNSISVHVRRGDYINQKAAATVHGICSPEYYNSSIEKIKTLVSNPCFFVFSDDMNWVKNNMHFPAMTTYIDHNDNDLAFQDLRLMSNCKHHIVANSSFSWWGAWLNPSLEKIVISPKFWFADQSTTPTLIPHSWIRI